jgi:hypothetical protein
LDRRSQENIPIIHSLSDRASAGHGDRGRAESPGLAASHQCP